MKSNFSLWSLKGKILDVQIYIGSDFEWIVLAFRIFHSLGNEILNYFLLPRITFLFSFVSFKFDYSRRRKKINFIIFANCYVPDIFLQKCFSMCTQILHLYTFVRSVKVTVEYICFVKFLRIHSRHDSRRANSPTI